MRPTEPRAGAASRTAPARPIPLPGRSRPPRGVRTIDDELAAIATILGHPVTRTDACAALRAVRPDLEVLADPETLGILRGRHLAEITAAIRAHLLGDTPARRRPTNDDRLRRDRERADWRRYFDGGHWFGYPPPPSRPTLGDRAQVALGAAVAFVVLLGLIVAAAMGVTR